MMDLCKTCSKPLMIVIEPEELGEFRTEAVQARGTVTVPDNVGLNCGCHFHCECLVDAYNLTTCPNCARDISSHNSAGIEQVLCSLDNEGGLQHEVDILPLLKYESYNKAFPEEQRPRAFLAFCAEGDIGTVIDEINDNGDDSDDEYGGEDNMQVDETSGREEIVNRIDPLRYQDPTDNMNSALHVAILNNQEEIAWVLLLIASTLEPNMFPTEVKQAASVLGAKREDQANKVDIRTLKNSDGKTGHDLAVEIGGVWNDWVNKRRLTA